MSYNVRWQQNMVTQMPNKTLEELLDGVSPEEAGKRLFEALSRPADNTALNPTELVKYLARQPLALNAFLSHLPLKNIPISDAITKLIEIIPAGSTTGVDESIELMVGLGKAYYLQNATPPYNKTEEEAYTDLTILTSVFKKSLINIEPVQQNHFSARHFKDDLQKSLKENGNSHKFDDKFLDSIYTKLLNDANNVRPKERPLKTLETQKAEELNLKGVSMPDALTRLTTLMNVPRIPASYVRALGEEYYKQNTIPKNQTPEELMAYAKLMAMTYNYNSFLDANKNYPDKLKYYSVESFITDVNNPITFPNKMLKKLYTQIEKSAGIERLTLSQRAKSLGSKVLRPIKALANILTKTRAKVKGYSRVD